MGRSLLQKVAVFNWTKQLWRPVRNIPHKIHRREHLRLEEIIGGSGTMAACPFVSISLVQIQGITLGHQKKLHQTCYSHFRLPLDYHRPLYLYSIMPRSPMALI